MPTHNQPPSQSPEQTPEEAFVAEIEQDLSLMEQAVAAGDVGNTQLTDVRDKLVNAASRVTPHWHRYDQNEGSLVEISRDEAGPDQPPSSYTLSAPNEAGDLKDIDIDTGFAQRLEAFLHESNKAADAEATSTGNGEEGKKPWPDLANLRGDVEAAAKLVAESGNLDTNPDLKKKMLAAARRVRAHEEHLPVGDPANPDSYYTQTTYTVHTKTKGNDDKNQSATHPVPKEDEDVAKVLLDLRQRFDKQPNSSRGDNGPSKSPGDDSGAGKGGNTLGKGSQGGNREEEARREIMGNMLRNDVETLLAIDGEIAVGITDVNRLMFFNRLLRRHTMASPDGNWLYVPAEWSEQERRLILRPDQPQQFVPKSPHGKVGDKVWEQADTNKLVERLLRLTEPNTYLLRDEQTRNMYRELAGAQILSPIHTDKMRENRKKKLQGNYDEPWGEGLLEWETRGDDDASIAAAAKYLRSNNAGMSEADAQRAAEQAARDGYLCRTDPNKVQDAIMERIGQLPGYHGNPVANPDRIKRAMDAMNDDNRRAVLKQIVTGGREEADKQALTDLVRKALNNGGDISHFIKGIDKPEKLAELFGSVMGTFDKTRDGIWRHNVGEATRNYAIKRYQELTGSSVDLVYQEHKTRIGKYYSIKRYQPFQMDWVLATMKIDALGKANMHDQLLAAKKTGAYAAAEIARLDVSGIQPFSGTPASHDAMAWHLFAMSHAREHGYGNNFLNYLYDLGEGAQRDDMAHDWLLHEGRDEGSKEPGDRRRERFLAAQGALQRSAGVWLRAYEGIWPADQHPLKVSPPLSAWGRLIPGNVRVPRMPRAPQQSQQQQGRRNNQRRHN